MSAFFQAMDIPQLIGFAIFIVMTVAFFAWVAYLGLSE